MNAVNRALAIIISLYNDADDGKGKKLLLEMLDFITDGLSKTKREKALISVLLHPLRPRSAMREHVLSVLGKEKLLMKSTVDDLARIASLNKDEKIKKLAWEIVQKHRKGNAKR